MYIPEHWSYPQEEPLSIEPLEISEPRALQYIRRQDRDLKARTVAMMIPIGNILQDQDIITVQRENSLSKLWNEAPVFLTSHRFWLAAHNLLGGNQLSWMRSLWIYTGVTIGETYWGNDSTLRN